MFATNTDAVNRIIVAEILDYVTETSSWGWQLAPTWPQPCQDGTDRL